MVKEVNRYTSNEFHEWQRENLPGNFVIQDLDAWAIVISDSTDNYEPLFLVELKRSFMEPASWNPFIQDLPNYAALYKLSKRAEIPLITIYFKKGQVICDDTEFAIFNIVNVNTKIEFEKQIITAKDLRDGFPDVIKGFVGD